MPTKNAQGTRHDSPKVANHRDGRGEVWPQGEEWGDTRGMQQQSPESTLQHGAHTWLPGAPGFDTMA